MWFSIQKKNEIHPPHNHPKSVLSGVYYIKIDKNSGGAINIDSKSEKIKYLPDKNDLLIFDSSTYHSVDVYNGKNDRISVAWDAIYSF
ncbi:putative 2OG-Fe(II) oxygenase [Candidatus Pelagibacter sp. Uisw_092]|uniref:putative 2OG-Fe(II) oxygenase n=1 Tax=Candidatus Pelagibacter sp. Uisw_092 TaxID=3230979 RepID=UPI0039EA47FF